jgi:peptidoglycan/xylan/chitin deacetylase (PgdA/CDA1 family)
MATESPRTALQLPISVNGAADELRLCLADERVPNLASMDVAVESRGPNRLCVSGAGGLTVYLTSDGTTNFDTPPSLSALPPLSSASTGSIEITSSVTPGLEAALWLIAYDGSERLEHVRVTLQTGTTTAAFTVPEATSVIRAALSLAGSGELEIESVAVRARIVPGLLVVSGDRFESWSPTTARTAIGSAVAPERPPTTIPVPGVPGDNLGASDARLPLFLTVDTEDAYFKEPRLMTGSGLGGEYGVGGVMDALERRGLRATFFVNVYESERQPAGSVQAVVEEIVGRGHEVGLHTHPAPELPWYNRPLFRQSRDEQAHVIDRGLQRIGSWTGREVVSYRAGGYAINDDTLAVLQQAGIRVDSSCFFPSPNNRNTRFTVNAVRRTADLIEVPITYVIRIDQAGTTLEHRKLDLDWLTARQLRNAVDLLITGNASCAMFMMHSFSFIEKATVLATAERSPRAIYSSPNAFDRHVEIYGPKPETRTAFDTFVDFVAGDPRVDVRTLAESLPRLEVIADSEQVDIVPVVARD